MKKAVILLLIISLVAGCGKIRELMNPTSDASAQAKAAAEAKAPVDPKITAPSGSETESKETTEKKGETQGETITQNLPANQTTLTSPNPTPVPDALSKQSWKDGVNLAMDITEGAAFLTFFAAYLELIPGTSANADSYICAVSEGMLGASMLVRWINNYW